MSVEKLGKYLQEYSARNKFNKPYPVYSVTNKIGFCVDYFDKDVSSKNKLNYKIVPRGYFAYNPSRVNVGSIDWQHKEDNVIVSPLYVVFKASAELNNDYLLYFLKSSVGKALIRNHTAGSVRDSLKFKDLCNISLNVPDIHEQESMINQLKYFESSIDSLTRRIELLDEQVKSLFNETCGTPLSPKYPMVKLGSIVRITSGGTPSRSKNNYWNPGTIPWVKTTELQGGEISSVEEYISEEGMVNSSAKIVPSGSILLAMYGQGKTRGMTGLLTIPASTNQACACLLDQGKMNQRFLWEWLKVCYEHLREVSSGSTTQPNLSGTILKDYPVVCPPLELQESLVEKITQINKLRFNYQRQIEVLQELLNKKMEEFFGVNE